MRKRGQRTTYQHMRQAVEEASGRRFLVRALPSVSARSGGWLAGWAGAWVACACICLQPLLHCLANAPAETKQPFCMLTLFLPLSPLPIGPPSLPCS